MLSLTNKGALIISFIFSFKCYYFTTDTLLPSKVWSIRTRSLISIKQKELLTSFFVYCLLQDQKFLLTKVSVQLPDWSSPWQLGATLITKPMSLAIGKDLLSYNATRLILQIHIPPHQILQSVSHSMILYLPMIIQHEHSLCFALSLSRSPSKIITHLIVNARQISMSYP